MQDTSTTAEVQHAGSSCWINEGIQTATVTSPGPRVDLGHTYNNKTMLKKSEHSHQIDCTLNNNNNDVLRRKACLYCSVSFPQTPGQNPKCLSPGMTLTKLSCVFFLTSQTSLLICKLSCVYKWQYDDLPCLMAFIYIGLYICIHALIKIKINWHSLAFCATETLEQPRTVRETTSFTMTKLYRYI